MFPQVSSLRRVRAAVGAVRKPRENPRDPAGVGVTRWHGDALGERIEPGQHGGLVALVEVPVAVEDD